MVGRQLTLVFRDRPGQDKQSQRDDHSRLTATRVGNRTHYRTFGDSTLEAFASFFIDNPKK